MRKQFWFLLALIAIAVVVFSVMGIRAWASSRNEGKLPHEEMLSADEAPRPVLVDEYGDPITVEPGAVSRYMLTQEYASLSAKEKQAFQDQVVAAYSDPALPIPMMMAEGEEGDRPMGGQNLTEAQREYLRQEAEPVMQRVEENRLARFFELSETEQDAIIDAHIDRMVAHMAEHARSGGGRGRDGRGNRGQVTDYPTRHLRRMNMGSPETRAQWQEFGRRLHARMEERGVESPWRH